MIRIDYQICMLARMGEATVLFFMILFLPVQFAARSADREGCVQKDQDIGLGDPLPHGLHIGMFLRDVTAGITILFKPLRSTWTCPNHRDLRHRQAIVTWRLHKIFVVTTLVVLLPDD